MDIKELEKLMITHGIVLRAIPRTVRIVVDARHINEFPDGEIKYLPEFHRDMCIAERAPKHAGQFLLEPCKNTSDTVRFYSRKFYNSIEEAMADLKAE